MSHFAAIQLISGPVHLNLDYVVKIVRGLDPKEKTKVKLITGETMSITRSEGDKLVQAAYGCCQSALSGSPAVLKKPVKKSAKKKAAKKAKP